MTPGLKTISLVLGIALALGALSAPSAMAETETAGSFVAAEYPMTLSGTQDGESHTITYPGGLGKTSCAVSQFEAVGSYAGSTTSMTVTPIYTLCNTELPGDAENPTTITHNGCTLVFTIHEEVSGSMSDTWKGDVNLQCPKDVKGIEIHAWDTEGKHENNEATKCTFLIEPQTIKGLIYHNETEAGEVTIEGKELLFTVKRTSGKVDDCGVATQTARYNGDISVDAYNEKGKSILTKIVPGMP
jgi:hypothetical protein